MELPASRRQTSSETNPKPCFESSKQLTTECCGHDAPVTAQTLTNISRDAGTEPAPTPAKRNWGTSAFPLIVAFLSALYLLQSASPIRLDNDSVVYLRMAASLVDGTPVESTGLPIGYPAFISVLDRLGLGYSFVFVMANCVFVAIGLAAVSYLFDRRDDGRQSWIVPLTMLSVPLIRYVPMHLPETLFFGMSLGAVAVMTASTKSGTRRRLSLLAIAIILTAIAITVRLAGFALVPPLIWACSQRVYRETGPRKERTKKEAWIGAPALFAVLVVAALVLGDSFRKYSHEIGLKYLRGDAFFQMAAHLEGFFESMGNVVVNLPSTQFSAYHWWFTAVGVAAVAGFVSFVRLRLPRTPVEVYLVSFIVMLLVWPYNALRLWLPIVPLFIGYAEAASLRFTPGSASRIFLKLYAAWFSIAGLAALAYTSRITLSGKDFPKVYGKAGGMSIPDLRTGRVDTLHNRRAGELMKRYGNPF